MGAAVCGKSTPPRNSGVERQVSVTIRRGGDRLSEMELWPYSQEPAQGMSYVNLRARVK